jgi:putative spermidine/putrescine transport system permease protein
MTRSRAPIGRWAIVALCVAFFAVPLVALAIFSFTSGSGWTTAAYSAIFRDPQFWKSVGLSLLLATLTTVLSLALMVPTVLWVHLRAPQYRSLIEAITLLVFAVPPITLVIGASGLLLGLVPKLLGTPLILVPFYIVLSFAFTFRALDAGVKSVDLHTLVDAAHSLGAGTASTVMRVILPNLRTAILGAAFLTITVVLGEYVLSSLFLYNTLPVYMADVGTSQAQGAAALALITVLFTWLLLIAVSVVSRRLGGQRVGTMIAST